MTSSPVIHWLGAGLSSGPGLLRLLANGAHVCLWNRTLANAHQLVAQATSKPKIFTLDLDDLANRLEPGDVVVSMLPADMHVAVAKLAIAGRAHFVSSSYVSEAMRGLDESAHEQQLCLVNEVGLDPGLDHLMAHLLVDAWRSSDRYDNSAKLSFRSYCGGFPAVSNDFCYKFSWSPVGVLRALLTPARYIAAGENCTAERPWEAITPYSVNLNGQVETFEAYPNRDSLPFMTEYNFDPSWPVEEFVRGTLRLEGWSLAWQGIFNTLHGASSDNREETLNTLSNELWQHHRYADNEPDRVVLSVELHCQSEQETLFHRACTLDSLGNETGSAMARLVSIPVSLAVDDILAGKISHGVSTAPTEKQQIEQWFSVLELGGDSVQIEDLPFDQ
ncbi:MAG: saccharopine dehydrogenase C-terminal domain-containing protein [Halioglobus sp.]